jgi:hypothetical protein
VIDGEDAPIIGQWDVLFSLLAIWSQQEDRAVAGKANKVNAIANATNLERQVMIHLGEILCRDVPSRCDRSHIRP